MKSLVRDGPRGEWGSSWCAPDNIAPMEKAQKPPPPPQTPVAPTPKSWASFFTSTFLGSGESPFHDGDEQDDEDAEAGVYDGVKPNMAGGVGVGVNFGGGDEGWKDVKLETVECEVPIKLWPGNTAFKAADIVFDV